MFCSFASQQIVLSHFYLPSGSIVSAEVYAFRPPLVIIILLLLLLLLLVRAGAYRLTIVKADTLCSEESLSSIACCQL